jgi:hypothetical protein
MGMIRNVILRRRAYVCAFNSIRFATRLRSGLSEFAPSIIASLDAVGDELATFARDICSTERERRSLIEGLQSALRSLQMSDAAQVQIMSRLAPRIMAGEPQGANAEAWQRIAV